MPKPCQCTPYQHILNQIQPSTLIWIAMTKTNGTRVPIPVGQAEKGHCQITWMIQHIIRIYCILNTELNIILLHWNKQHLESGIVQWGCRPLNENIHLVLVFTCFPMQICHRLERWAMWFTLYHKINLHLPSKQTSARGGKVYPYNGFLNLFSTCSSAFWRLTLSSWSIS